MLKKGSSRLSLTAAILGLASALLVLGGNYLMPADALPQVGFVMAAALGAALVCALPIFLDHMAVTVLTPLVVAGLNACVICGLVAPRYGTLIALVTYNPGNEAGWKLLVLVLSNVFVALASTMTFLSATLLYRKPQ